jgi:hypothetical protein
MHVHLPKPLHGWRQFVGEVGIIVLGVLIALGFEQIAESVRWHVRAAEARTALQAEVGHGFLVTEERQAVVDCLDQQLSRIESAVISSNTMLKPLPVYSDNNFRFTVRAPIRSFTDSAWRSVIAEGITAHLNGRERELLPIYYAQMEHIRALGDGEEDALGNLLALSQPLRLDPQVQANFIREIENERLRNQEISGTEEQMMHTIERVGYVPSREERRDWLKHSGTIKFCREQHLPLGTS